MRVSTTALYTLAALIAGDLTQQAIAKPVSTTAPERPEAGDIESAAELALPSSIDAVTPPEQLQAIAFAEAVLTQYSEEYTRELTEIGVEADAVVAVPADSVGPAEIATAEIDIAAVAMLATMPAPEIMGVEHSSFYLDDSAESINAVNELEPQAVLTEEWTANLASSGYYESAVAPPEAIATPERMPESVPKLIEAIAIPESFMPERSEALLDEIEAPVNVLLPTTLSAEFTQTYALNAIEDDEDLWIQAMIESEFAEQESTEDWVAAPTLEFEEGVAIASTAGTAISSMFSQPLA